MVRPVMSTLPRQQPLLAPRPDLPHDCEPVPRDAGHAPAEAASALGWRNQHLLHPQMLGRSVVMH
jgi:hypothetical protein